MSTLRDRTNQGERSLFCSPSLLGQYPKLSVGSQSGLSKHKTPSTKHMLGQRTLVFSILNITNDDIRFWQFQFVIKALPCCDGDVPFLCAPPVDFLGHFIANQHELYFHW